MRKIQSPGESPDWDSKLIKDLGYIKKYLRYPIPKTKLLLSVAAALVLGLLMRGSFFALSIYESQSHNIGSYIGLALSFIPAIILIPRLIGQTRFLSIPTQLNFQDNQLLLEKFLKSQNLVIFRNEEAPEVFQILSRNISAFREQREVLIFIADEQRILLNSHFTSGSSRFRLNTARRRHREMGDMLRKWITAYRISVKPGVLYQG